ncbi:MAG: TIGR04211 family SH3 domain-containing protein [Desulfobacteraceae bacterium]|jgi:SH3 domain protein|nr:MAG: TIGR04211 family SH3 domain-containing protein [Desulfobacteraceae bacterium]
MIRTRMIETWIVFFIAAFFASSSFGTDAKNAYVSDNLEAALRSGPSTQHKIIAMLKSGREVEVLDSSEGWSLVKVQGKAGSFTEGWILSRYLMNRIPWEIQARALEEQNVSLKEKTGPLEDSLRSSKIKEVQLEKQLKESNEALDLIKKKYESLAREAATYLDLKESFRNSQEALTQCRQEVEETTAENQKLKSSDRKMWFLAGALVLLCGLMIGLVAGRQQRKKKSLLFD